MYVEPGQRPLTSVQLVEQLLDLSDLNAQKAFLHAHASQLNSVVADLLQQRARRYLRSAVQQALDIADLLSYIGELAANPLYRALGLLVEANACSIGGLGKHRRAIELYDQAAGIYQAHGRTVEQANTQIGKIFSLAMLGCYEEALQTGRWVKVLEENREWRAVVKMTTNLAIAHGRHRKDAQALAQLDQAKKFCLKLETDGHPQLQLIEHNRAVVLRNLGRFEASVEASQAAWKLAVQLGHRAEVGRVQQALAFTYLLQGRYNEALDYLNQAHDVFMSDGRRSDAVLVDLFISNCLLQLRRFDEVLAKCREQRQLFTAWGMPREAADVTLNRAIACAGLRRYDEALDLLSEARALFEQEDNQVQVVCTDMERAAVLYHQARFEESLEAAESCARSFKARDLALQEAQAHLVAARAETALERYPAARQRVACALAIGRTKDIPSLVYQCYHLSGTLAQTEGNQQEALSRYDRAIEALERLRGRLMVEFRADFLQDKQVIYEDAVALCLDMEQPAQGLAYAERAKSRVLVDLLAHRLDIGIQARESADEPLIADLLDLKAERDRIYRRWEAKEGFAIRGRNAAQSTQHQVQQDVVALERKIESLWHKLLIRNADYARDAALCQFQAEPIQPYLEPGTLLLEYFVARGRLVVFLVTDQTVRSRCLPADLSRMHSLLQFFWLNLRAAPRAYAGRIAGLAANARGLLQHLYDLVAAPLADVLGAYERLIVVPHGPLHYLPFHALYDGERFLLEKHLISYLPGASLLRYCTEPRPLSHELLALGHSYGGVLPYAVQEARTVAEILCGEAMVEGNATAAGLREKASECQVVHLAAHGDFRPDNPLFSGLALSDGWLTTLDIFGLRLKASLVTLSACQTGRNVVAGGDELLGLMRAFLYAGAASLVLSLWAVEDRSTSLLMESFYQGLAQGSGKGQALRDAQLCFVRPEGDLCDPETAAFLHPYFWASFFLVGDTGVLHQQPCS